jgi:hypothetical protein
MLVILTLNEETMGASKKLWPAAARELGDTAWEADLLLLCADVLLFEVTAVDEHELLMYALRVWVSMMLSILYVGCWYLV